MDVTIACGGAIPAPAYRRIMQAIRDDIARGALAPGARVPSEHQLVERFAVSRMTANRALRDLAQEGLIIRTAGSGSFVAEQRLEISLLVVPDIAAEITASGRAYSARVIEALAISAPKKMADALGLESGARVFRSLIVHSADQQPMQVEDRLVNPAFAPHYLAQDFTRSTPNSYLTAIGRIEEVEQTIEAVAADTRLAGLLGIPRHSPCLTVTRRTWSHGMTATRVTLTSPGQSWRLTARFRPGA